MLQSIMRMKGYHLPSLTMFIVFNILHYFCGLPALICCVNALSPDGVALLEIKSSFEIPPYVLSSWRNSSSDVDPCNWEGVKCSNGSRRVTSISLPNRSLSGRLSSAIGKMAALKNLNLSGNHLRGAIPRQIANCTRIRKLNLANNSFTEFIPPDIGNCSLLTVLDLSKNIISGFIPPELGNLVRLTTLSVDTNNLSGIIPSDIGKLHQRLLYLGLSYNNFEGTLPDAIGRFPNLKALCFSNNSFEGPLPSSLGSFSNLEYLESYSNRLSGSIPSGLCSRGSLTNLVIFGNRLEGNITGLLQDCASLQRVRLQDNLFTGFIPRNISMLSALYFLDISKNSIHGSIPSSLGKMHNLTNLVFSDNNLSGVIPPEIGELTKLGKLNLSRNNLTGTIPPEIGNLTKLLHLDLSGNSLESSIPAALGHLMALEKLNLSANALTGRIPSSLRYCRQLNELDLARNQLSMTIPLELGNLAASLKYGLDLSWNNLSGPLPPQIGSMMYLESLDVSHNQLSGQIPEPSKSLSHFNFSFNLFTGSIPSSKAFLQGPQNAFEGNPGLCGPPTKNNCSDSEGTHRNKKISSVEVAGIAVACFGAVTIFSLALMYMIKTNQKPNKEDCPQDIYSGEGGAIMKYRDIVEATEDFSDDYVIGYGTSGMVYKVAIPGRDKIVAAKCLKLPNHRHDDNRYRSLRHEIESLKHARHRNILRHRGLITEHDVVVLLCDYMVNGSLWEYLGGASKRPNKKLDWRARYNIAVGVAEGLKYLHHDCESAIIHCDIKSANILLDDEYVAHIADFGLARLVKNPSIDSESSSLFGGTFGYVAPECGYGVKASTKQDVYSFGVVLLELVSGKGPVVEEGDQEFVHLTAWAARMTKEGRMDEIIGEDLRSSSDYIEMKDEIVKMIEIATLCTQSAPNLRPSMKVVLDTFHRL